jgi:hydroxyquinol 1,2-dioxygenase
MMDKLELGEWRNRVRKLQTGSGDPRIVTAVDCILDAAFKAVHEARPTVAEWLATIDFIAAAGPAQMRGIGSILGLNRIVEEINNPMGPDATDQCGATSFHVLHDRIEPGDPLCDVDDEGDYLFFEGRVLSTSGTPLAGVEVDFSGTDGHGLYSKRDHTKPGHDLRGRVRSGPDGRYSIFTKFPRPYSIATDAVGRVLEAMGHQPWRPAHLHFKLDHPGFEPLTTQIFFAGEPYIEVDPALAAKPHLTVDLERHERPDKLAERQLNRPFYTADFDFRLQPAGQA